MMGLFLPGFLTIILKDFWHDAFINNSKAQFDWYFIKAFIPLCVWYTYVHRLVNDN